MLSFVEDEMSENEKLLNKIKILSKDLVNLEKMKKYSDSMQTVEKIVNLIKITIDKNKDKLNKDHLNWLFTLQKSYEAKLSSYEYYSFVNEKTMLIRQKMTEKYLGKKNKINEFSSSVIDNPSKISEFEIIPNSKPIDIIKDIIEVCSSLIKFYEIQLNKSNENINLKKVNNYESFFVYDIQNTTANPQNFFDRYIEEIKFIKIECEKLIELDLRYEHDSIKDLEKKITIIKEEIFKIYPKYKSLKEILEKKGLVKNKNKK